MGMGLCVTFIALIRLPSLKVSTLLLTGLLLYDVFWVFCSSYIFTTNVMVKVATRSVHHHGNSHQLLKIGLLFPMISTWINLLILSTML